ncbi:hypothetical protein QE152_g25677 [Popillia japonica]|uniref:Uncharacterized protein n=1 Tax=Popillia japonica TaxID=7064 RepID=A0AAW1K0A9_POPJA
MEPRGYWRKEVQMKEYGKSELVINIERIASVQSFFGVLLLIPRTMPRTYRRVTEKASWTSEQLQAAVKSIENGTPSDKQHEK